MLADKQAQFPLNRQNARACIPISLVGKHFEVMIDLKRPDKNKSEILDIKLINNELVNVHKTLHILIHSFQWAFSLTFAILGNILLNENTAAVR